LLLLTWNGEWQYNRLKKGITEEEEEEEEWNLKLKRDIWNGGN
jgi:hypothetical protein